VKRKTVTITIVLTVIAIIAIVFSLKFNRLLKIDECLDKGGSWNNERNDCQYADSFHLTKKTLIERDNTKIDSNIKWLKKAKNIDLDKSFNLKILKNEEFLDVTTDGGGLLKAYYRNKQIVKISLWLGLSYGNSTFDYYFNNKKLFYIYETFNQFIYIDSINGFNYNKTETTFIGKYYFMNDILFDFETTGHNRFEDNKIDPEEILLKETSHWVNKFCIK